MEEISEAWQTGLMTLRSLALDQEAIESALASDVALLDRVRYLARLHHGSEALREGLRLLEDSPDRAELLLFLAQVIHRQHRWHEAAVLQEAAMQLATTRVEEATVRHHTGRRLFDEARYRDAAAEFQWAADLYRVSGRHGLAERSEQAMERARQGLTQAEEFLLARRRSRTRPSRLRPAEPAPAERDQSSRGSGRESRS